MTSCQHIGMTTLQRLSVTTCQYVTKTAQFVLEEGLCVASRHGDADRIDDSWTCCRSFDGAKVQIDFILIDGRGELVTTWCDFILPIGLDHRCVHCNIRFTIPTLGKKDKQRSLKGWKPFLDETGVPKKIHDAISEQYNAHDEVSFANLEGVLAQAAQTGGAPHGFKVKFVPSDCRKGLRRSRRTAVDLELRKQLSF